jgi:hypothetical protein
MPERYGFGGLQQSETEAESNSLEIFAPEAVEANIRERKPCQAKPTAGIQGTGPFEIYLPAEKSTFIDPGSFRINGKFKIKQVDATTKLAVALAGPPAADAAPPCYPNDFLTKNIFKEVIVEAQSKMLSINSSNTYAIKAVTESLFSFGTDAKHGHLRCSYHHKDTPGQKDSYANNVAGKERYNIIAASKTVELCDNIHTELTTTNRYIVPGVDLKFKFVIEEPSTFLVAKEIASEFVIEFHDFYLTYDRLLLKEDVHESIEKRLVTAPAIYPITRTEIRCKGFATGLTSLEWNNAYQGNLPEQILLCMNLQEAADGKSNKNLLNFQDFGMTELSLIVNSLRRPAVPLKFSFPTKDCMSAYRHLWDNCGTDISNAPGLITYEDFVAGTTIIPFDLTTDRCAMYHGHEKKDGSVSVDIKLSAATTQAINMYVICIYKDYFFIYGNSDNRRVSLTYPTNLKKD